MFIKLTPQEWFYLPPGCPVWSFPELTPGFLWGRLWRPRGRSCLSRRTWSSCPEWPGWFPWWGLLGVCDPSTGSGTWDQKKMCYFLRGHLQMRSCKFELFWPPPLCHAPMYYALCTGVTQLQTLLPLLARCHLWMAPYWKLVMNNW